MAEHSVGWYLRRKEQTLGTQELESEAERYSWLEKDHPSLDPPRPLLRKPQYKPPTLQYEEPRCSQDQNPLELASDLELAKEMNDPPYLAESYRNLLKEYRSHTLDLLPPLPPPSP